MLKNTSPLIKKKFNLNLFTNILSAPYVIQYNVVVFSFWKNTSKVVYVNKKKGNTTKKEHI